MLGDEAEQLIYGERHPEHQMSHDFAGASEVDEAPTELIFQPPV